MQSTITRFVKMCLFVEVAGNVNAVYSMSHMCAMKFKHGERGASGALVNQPWVLGTSFLWTAFDRTDLYYVAGTSHHLQKDNKKRGYKSSLTITATVVETDLNFSSCSCERRKNIADNITEPLTECAIVCGEIISKILRGFIHTQSRKWSERAENRTRLTRRHGPIEISSSPDEVK